MNYIGLTFAIVFITCIVVALIQCYQCEKQHAIEYNAKRPENISVELRAYKDTYGITDENFINTLPYNLEYKAKNDNWWKPIYMFQKSKDDKYGIQRIVIKDHKDLENWKQKFKTLQDINNFKITQEELMKLWEEKETDKNCIY
jgi:hypothetical protein